MFGTFGWRPVSCCNTLVVGFGPLLSQALVSWVLYASRSGFYDGKFGGLAVAIRVVRRVHSIGDTFLCSGLLDATILGHCPIAFRRRGHAWWQRSCRSTLATKEKTGNSRFNGLGDVSRPPK